MSKCPGCGEDHAPLKGDDKSVRKMLLAGFERVYFEELNRCTRAIVRTMAMFDIPFEECITIVHRTLERELRHSKESSEQTLKDHPPVKKP